MFDIDGVNKLLLLQVHFDVADGVCHFLGLLLQKLRIEVIDLASHSLTRFCKILHSFVGDSDGFVLLQDEDIVLLQHLFDALLHLDHFFLVLVDGL